MAREYFLQFKTVETYYKGIRKGAYDFDDEAELPNEKKEHGLGIFVEDLLRFCEKSSGYVDPIGQFNRGDENFAVLFEQYCNLLNELERLT